MVVDCSSGARGVRSSSPCWNGWGWCDRKFYRFAACNFSTWHSPHGALDAGAIWTATRSKSYEGGLALQKGFSMSARKRFGRNRGLAAREEGRRHA
jgi:hypothetical protein